MTVQVVSDSRISGIFTSVKLLRVDRACAEVITPSDAFTIPVEAGRWLAAVEAPQGLVIRTANGSITVHGDFRVKVTGMGRVHVDMPTDKWFSVNAPLVTFDSSGAEEEKSQRG